MARLLFRVRELLRLSACRLRVHAMRLAGGREIDRKCLFGSGVRINRPWAVSLGMRCVLDRHVRLGTTSDTARIEIGAFTFIGRGTELDASGRITIGHGGLIGPGVVITDHNHGTAPGRPMFEQACVVAGVTIGEDVWIGANCVVLPGVTIGPGAVVGAGAVVACDVPARAIAAGVPARILGYRE